MIFSATHWPAVLATALCSMCVQPASGMDIKVLDGGLPVRVELSGTIQIGDGLRIGRKLDELKPKGILGQLEVTAPLSLYDPRQWLWVQVDSTGGAFDDALALGLYLRSANALIQVKRQCRSSCIFLLAGAVERAGLQAANVVIGIHRPYSVDSSNTSEADLTRLFDGSYRKISGFLHEMRVAPELTDAMLAYAPEYMHVLSHEEVDRFLPERDPVWDETTIARRAKIVGVTSVALRDTQIMSRDCNGAVSPNAKGMTSPACPANKNLAMPVDDIIAQKLLFAGKCGHPYFLYYLKHAGNADFLPCAPEFGLPVVLGQR